MVWVYQSPLNEKERKAYEVLKERFRDDKLAKDTAKVISLYAILKSSTFESPKDIEDNFFFDESKTQPIFNKVLSEELFKQLKKTGGAASNYPFTDYSARQGLKKLETALPGYIVYPVENFYNLLTKPILTIKQQVPIIDLAISAGNGLAETGITAVGDIAKTFGGPIGTAISIPIVAFAAALATMTSLLQQDFGQSVVYMVTALPIVGGIMVKGLDKIEKQVAKIKKYPELAYYVPVVSDFINEQRRKKGLPPLEPFDPQKAIQNKIQSNPYAQKAMALKNKIQENPYTQKAIAIQNKVQTFSNAPAAGKRFSTQKNKHNKWKRTRRNKSAKI